MAPYSLYTVVHYFWQEPHGPWSKIVYYIMSFPTLPGLQQVDLCSEEGEPDSGGGLWAGEPYEAGPEGNHHVIKYSVSKYPRKCLAWVRTAHWSRSLSPVSVAWSSLIDRTLIYHLNLLSAVWVPSRDSLGTFFTFCSITWPGIELPTFQTLAGHTELAWNYT